MTLSIITINYNNFEGLRKTIDSVLSQTWHDYEWIIIDGGSTDGSKELIEETANKLASSDFNPLSYWCSEPDKGIYNAMNKGIKHCKGEYINCMNSGDEFYEAKTLANIFKITHNADVLYGNAFIYNQTENHIDVPPHSIDIISLYNCGLCHQTMFVRNDSLIQIGFNEKYKICSDYAKWIELLLNNKIFKYIDIEICRYDATGFSSKNVQQRRNERNIIQEEYFPPFILKFIEKYNNSPSNNPYIIQATKIIQEGGISSYILKNILMIIKFKDKIKKYLNIK